MGETLIIAIISSLVTGSVSVIGTIIANNRKMAILETKLEYLTDEVRRHNNFALRMPVVEEQIKVANHRIEDMEHRIEVSQ